jgi:hypothetical protein
VAGPPFPFPVPLLPLPFPAFAENSRVIRIEVIKTFVIEDNRCFAD